MKVGDLVKMKDTRFHKEIGVVTKTFFHGDWRIEIHWADGRVGWESKLDLTLVKKCP
jgi:hypothetical protein